jgi:cystathionine gamma-synthase
MHLSTKLIHQNNVSHESAAVISPMILSTTFERGENGLDHPGGYVYSRYDNPNRRSLEEKLAGLEQGETAISFSSGLAAANAIFQTLQPGDHILLPDDIYFAVRSLLDQVFSGFQITYSMVDMTDTSKIEKAILPTTKLLWIETPSNPSLKITDIAYAVSIAEKNKLIVVVDNTWATPFCTNPLLIGADIVLHSTTKYLGGHSDLLGGVLIFKENNSLSEKLRVIQKLGGAVPSAFDCWLLCRSLTTFSARMEIHCRNGLALATYLQSRPEIEKVYYPGLPSHPQHATALKQMQNGFSGMLSVLVKGNQETALLLAGKLQLFKHATSLGGVESLIEPRKSVEGTLSATPENLLRISVGIENINDLIHDFEQAFEQINA